LQEPVRQRATLPKPKCGLLPRRPPVRHPGAVTSGRDSGGQPSAALLFWELAQASEPLPRGYSLFRSAGGACHLQQVLPGREGPFECERSPWGAVLLWGGPRGLLLKVRLRNPPMKRLVSGAHRRQELILCPGLDWVQRGVLPTRTALRGPRGPRELREGVVERGGPRLPRVAWTAWMEEPGVLGGLRGCRVFREAMAEEPELPEALGRSQGLEQPRRRLEGRGEAGQPAPVWAVREPQTLPAPPRARLPARLRELPGEEPRASQAEVAKWGRRLLGQELAESLPKLEKSETLGERQPGVLQGRAPRVSEVRRRELRYEPLLLFRERKPQSAHRASPSDEPFPVSQPPRVQGALARRAGSLAAQERVISAGG
jgi:hypothetical protein